MEIPALVASQRTCFMAGETRPVEHRIHALARLKELIRARQDDIARALQADLGKGADESFLCETGLVLSELSCQIAHLRRWARPRPMVTDLVNLPAASSVVPQPKGVVLVMSTWNYPFLLSLDPLAGALAAGNCVVLKVSPYAPASAALIAEMVGELFDPSEVAVVSGHRDVNEALLAQPFDHVFFTGSQHLGSVVMARCAERLCPVTLELGGKSPAVVAADADVPVAARRIVFGKFLNAGQTCVAPDHVYVHRSVHDRFMEALGDQIAAQYPDALADPGFGRIVNARHFERVRGLVDPAKVVLGGRSDATTLKIEPTVMDGVEEGDAVMGQEIFGPVLPVLTYDSMDDLLALQRSKPHPLASYVFTRDRGLARRFVSEVPSGGSCVNDVVMQIASTRLPFGGFGASGMGAYHGRASFDTFSHLKAVVDQPTLVSVPLRYRPYRRAFMALTRLVMGG